MTEGIIALLVAVYCFFQAYRKKSKRVFFLAFIIFSLQLTQWPFFLPFGATGCALGAVSACFCFYDSHRKKDKTLIVYALVFLYFSVSSILPLFTHTT
jgi:hypothetical protein